MQMFMKEHKANEAIRSEPKLKIPIEDQNSRNKVKKYFNLLEFSILSLTN